MIVIMKILFCFHRWSAKGKYFGRLGEDSISIYETPVSCCFFINLSSFRLLLADFGFSLPHLVQWRKGVLLKVTFLVKSNILLALLDYFT